MSRGAARAGARRALRRAAGLMPVLSPALMPVLPPVLLPVLLAGLLTGVWPGAAARAETPGADPEAGMANPAAQAVAGANAAAQASARAGLNALAAPELELLATKLAAAGRDAEALQVAEVLLLRDPENALGHYIVAQILLRAGQTGTARIAARESFQNAGTERQRYEAARLAAKVAVADKRWFAAQYWARHTGQYAPDAERRAIAARDFRLLQAASPWQASLKLGVKPSNNVNGGADERTNVIDGFDAVGWLSDDAMALPGVIGTASTDISYRIAQDRDSVTRLGLAGYARVVELQGRPVMVPPYVPGTPPPPAVEIRNSDYSSASLGAELSHERRLGPRASGVGALSHGQVWQAGAKSYRYTGASLRGAWATAEGAAAPRLSFGASVEARDFDTSPREDLRRSADLGLARALGWGQLSLGLSASALDSDVANARSWSVSGVVRFEPARKLGPLAFAVSGGVSRTVYPDYQILFFAPDGGRQDEMVYAEIGVWAPEMGYAGFTPELKLQALSVESNVSRFTRSEMSVAVGLRSTF